LGVFVAIEVKVPGEKPDPIQLAIIDRWTKAGAIAFWAEKSEGVVDRVVNLVQQKSIDTFLLG
jgi:hypothetical protein